MPHCLRPPPRGTGAGQCGPPDPQARATPDRADRRRRRRESCVAAVFVSAWAGAVAVWRLFRRRCDSAFQRSRLSFIFAKQYFRLLFFPLAALHLAFHLSRLPQKNRTNLEIGLRNGNDSPLAMGPPPCHPTKTSSSGHNTKRPPMEQKPANDTRSVFPEDFKSFHLPTVKPPSFLHHGQKHHR